MRQFLPVPGEVTVIRPPPSGKSPSLPAENTISMSLGVPLFQDQSSTWRPSRYTPPLALNGVPKASFTIAATPQLLVWTRAPSRNAC